MHIIYLLQLLLLQNIIAALVAEDKVTFYKNTQGSIPAYFNTNASRVLRWTYKIVTPQRQWIRLEWRRFHINGKMPMCIDDSVTVYTGCSNPKRVAVFCSTNMRSLPHPIYSPDNCMTIRLENHSFQSKGFEARYKSYPMSQAAPAFQGSCSSFFTKNVYALTGAIGSPRWPTKYEEDSCSWRLKTRDTGMRYVLNIMDMDLYRSSSCSYLSDNVEIKGEKSMTTKRKSSWRYCSASSFSDNDLDTVYYELKIKSRIRYSRTGRRGFIIGFIAYEDEVARALTSWGSIVGSLVVAAFAVVFIFCCYRRWRQRQLYEGRPLVVQGQQPTVVAPGPPVEPVGPNYPLHPGGYPIQPGGPSPYNVPPPVYTDKPPDYPGYAPPGYAPPAYPGQQYPPPAGQQYPPQPGQQYPPPAGQQYPPPPPPSSNGSVVPPYPAAYPTQPS